MDSPFAHPSALLLIRTGIEQATRDSVVESFPIHCSWKPFFYHHAFEGRCAALRPVFERNRCAIFTRFASVFGRDVCELSPSAVADPGTFGSRPARKQEWKLFWKRAGDWLSCVAIRRIE